MKPTVIYVLCDPDTGDVRYVGKTIQSLHQRRLDHLRAVHNTRSARWIRKLLAAGKSPTIHVLDYAGTDWPERDVYWIARLKELGCSLTNTSNGGDGSCGYSISDETRRKLSRASTGRKRSQESIARMSRALKGRTIPLEQREKIAATLRGTVMPLEVRAKISSANKGRPKPPRSEIHRLRISEKAKGRKASAEVNARRSEKLKEHVKTDEHRRNLSIAARKRWARSKVPE